MTEPWTTRNDYNSIAGLMHSNRTIFSVTVHQWILRPTSFVRAYTTTAYHFFHFSGCHLQIFASSHGRYTIQVKKSEREKKTNGNETQFGVNKQSTIQTSVKYYNSGEPYVMCTICVYEMQIIILVALTSFSLE